MSLNIETFKDAVRQRAAIFRSEKKMAHTNALIGIASQMCQLAAQEKGASVNKEHLATVTDNFRTQARALRDEGDKHSAILTPLESGSMDTRRKERDAARIDAYKVISSILDPNIPG